MLGQRVFAWARRTPYLADLPRDVAVLSFVAFAVALGYGIAAPALPVYARTFGVSAFVASTVISGFALMRLLSAGPSGLLVDRFGERRIMSIGIWVVAGSSLLTAAAQNFPPAARPARGGRDRVGDVHRLGDGPAAAHGRPGAARPGVRGIPGRVPVRRRDRAGDRRGGDRHLDPRPVRGVRITLVVAGLLAVKYLSRAPVAVPDAPASSDASTDAVIERAGPQGVKAPPASLSAALRSAAYRASLMVNLSSGFIVFGLRISLVPLFVTEGLEQGVGLVGIGFLCAAATQAVMLIPAGRWTDRSGRRGSMLVGAATLTVSMLLLALPTGAVGFLVAMAASGLASAFLAPASAAVVGDLTRGLSGGRVVSVYQMVGDLGGILGPLIAGALADAAGFQWAFAAGVVVGLVTLAFVVVMPETLRREPEGSPAGAPPPA